MLGTTGLEGLCIGNVTQMPSEISQTIKLNKNIQGVECNPRVGGGSSVLGTVRTRNRRSCDDLDQQLRHLRYLCYLNPRVRTKGCRFVDQWAGRFWTSSKQHLFRFQLSTVLFTGTQKSIYDGVERDANEKADDDDDDSNCFDLSIAHSDATSWPIRQISSFPAEIIDQSTPVS